MSTTAPAMPKKKKVAASAPFTGFGIPGLAEPDEDEKKKKAGLTFLHHLARHWGYDDASRIPAEYHPLLNNFKPVEPLPASRTGVLQGQHPVPHGSERTIAIHHDRVHTEAKLTPEAALEMAFIMKSHPEAAKGVELHAMTEDDKRMLAAAAKAVGLVITNAPAGPLADYGPLWQDMKRRAVTASPGAAPKPAGVTGAAAAGAAAAAAAPATSAPATSAPATSAPATSAPATSAPATSAPATSAPATSAPATSAPAQSQQKTVSAAAPAHASERGEKLWNDLSPQDRRVLEDNYALRGDRDGKQAFARWIDQNKSKSTEDLRGMIKDRLDDLNHVKRPQPSREETLKEKTNDAWQRIHNLPEDEQDAVYAAMRKRVLSEAGDHTPNEMKERCRNRAMHDLAHEPKDQREQALRDLVAEGKALEASAATAVARPTSPPADANTSPSRHAVQADTTPKALSLLAADCMDKFSEEEQQLARDYIRGDRDLAVLSEDECGDELLGHLASTDKDRKESMESMIGQQRALNEEAARRAAAAQLSKPDQKLTASAPPRQTDITEADLSKTLEAKKYTGSLVALPQATAERAAEIETSGFLARLAPADRALVRNDMLAKHPEMKDLAPAQLEREIQKKYAALPREERAKAVADIKRAAEPVALAHTQAALDFIHEAGLTDKFYDAVCRTLVKDARLTTVSIRNSISEKFKQAQDPMQQAMAVVRALEADGFVAMVRTDGQMAERLVVRQPAAAPPIRPI